MRAIAVIIAIHGLIHLLAPAKSFGFLKLEALRSPVSKPMAILWLLSAIIWLAGAWMIMADILLWWTLIIPNLLLSQSLIISQWTDAKFGSIVNAFILLITGFGFGHWNFERRVAQEFKSIASAPLPEVRFISEADLIDLPELIQNWLRSVGLVDQPSLRLIELEQTGRMRIQTEGKWMPFDAKQIIRPNDPSFAWKTRVRAWPGVYLTGRDLYQAGHGHMLIKLWSLIPIVDSHGTDIDQGSALRFLGEMVWFPSKALSPQIRWEQLDQNTALAIFSYQDQKVSGHFRFNSQGMVTQFEALRYFSQGKASSLERWQIDINPKAYKRFQNLVVPTQGQITWKLENGDFTWFEFEIRSLTYY